MERHRYEVWQDGKMQDGMTCPSMPVAFGWLEYYAMYRTNGSPVEIRYYSGADLIAREAELAGESQEDGYEVDAAGTFKD